MIVLRRARRLQSRHVRCFAVRTLPKQPIGLYDPRQEKDSCGVGLVASLKSEQSRQIVARTRRPGKRASRAQ